MLTVKEQPIIISGDCLEDRGHSNLGSLYSGGFTAYQCAHQAEPNLIAGGLKIAIVFFPGWSLTAIGKNQNICVCLKFKAFANKALASPSSL